MGAPRVKCPTCDYDLAGLEQDRCPECAAPFDPRTLARGGPSLPSEVRSKLMVGGAGVALVWVSLLGLCVQGGDSLLLFLLVIWGASGLLLCFSSLPLLRAAPSGIGRWIAASPALTWSLLFWTLIPHLRLGLGRWPVMNDPDLSPALEVHANLAHSLFGVFILGVVTILPLAAILCIAVPELRPRAWSFYLGVMGLAIALGTATLLLAPKPILDWWWD